MLNGITKNSICSWEENKTRSITFIWGRAPYGLYFHDKKLIQINSNLRHKCLLETIRHEMMEASLLISGVGFLETYEQEAVVRCMEEIFFPAWALFLKRIKFKDNA